MLATTAKGSSLSGVTETTVFNAHALRASGNDQLAMRLHPEGLHRLVIAAGNYTLLETDRSIAVNKTVGQATQVTLPTSPQSGYFCWVKDAKGDAGTNNITIVPAAGLIDGNANYVINRNYGSACFQYNGTNWNCIAESGPQAAVSADILEKYFEAMTRLVGSAIDAQLKSSDGGATDKDKYTFDLSTGDMLVNGVFARFTALNDEVLIGAGEWGKSYNSAGGAAVVLSADGTEYYCHIVAIGSVLHAVFSDEAASGAGAALSAAATRAALVAAGVTGHGTIVATIKINRNAVDTIVMTHADPASDATLAGYRAKGCLYNL